MKDNMMASTLCSSCSAGRAEPWWKRKLSFSGLDHWLQTSRLFFLNSFEENICKWTLKTWIQAIYVASASSFWQVFWLGSEPFDCAHLYFHVSAWKILFLIQSTKVLPFPKAKSVVCHFFSARWLAGNLVVTQTFNFTAIQLLINLLPSEVRLVRPVITRSFLLLKSRHSGLILTPYVMYFRCSCWHGAFWAFLLLSQGCRMHGMVAVFLIQCLQRCFLGSALITSMIKIVSWRLCNYNI